MAGSLDYLREQKEIDPNRKRDGTPIKELASFKTMKVKQRTYERLLNLKKKLYFQIKGAKPSFDFALNFLMDKFESTMEVKTMGKVILETEIKREKGLLYYCGTNKSTGNLTICSAVMVHGRKKKK